ncbi:DUF1801 domain-containing protein [Piscinibacter sakaiensis]|uniref:DUF1801 domain-containing protein n=1 Tax=Piscinibacter sakaiensis TaxID=1547922 RepID=UPI003AAE49A5
MILAPPPALPNAGQQIMRQDNIPSVVAVDQVFAAASAGTRTVAEALYALVLRVHPHAHILAWPKQRIISFGVGPKKMSQHHAYIAIQSAHVNLGFYIGTSLQDRSKLLEGTGKNLRHVKLRSVEEARAPAVRALIETAFQERRAAACVAR